LLKRRAASVNKKNTYFLFRKSNQNGDVTILIGFPKKEIPVFIAQNARFGRVLNGPAFGQKQGA
jgi:hypothetical protein